MNGPEFTTSADGTVIAYEVTGEGPTLVYVTGAICHRTFRPVRQGAAHLAERFRVVNLDRRGRGDSGLGEPWSLAREIEDLEAVIDAVGGRAVLYGHSSGAVLALHAAARLPDKVDRVALYDASWARDASEAEEYAVLRTEVDRLLIKERGGAAIRRFLIGIGMPRAFALLLPLMPGWRRLVALAPTLRHDLALTAEPPPLEVAASVTVPVHVMVGEKSPAELRDVAAALAGAIPGATHEVVPGQDHMVSEKVILPSLVTALG